MIELETFACKIIHINGPTCSKVNTSHVCPKNKPVDMAPQQKTVSNSENSLFFSHVDPSKIKI